MTAAPFPPSHHPQPCHTASTIACRSSEEFAALQPAGKGQYHLAITRRVQSSLFSNPHLQETATLLLSSIQQPRPPSPLTPLEIDVLLQ
jgi:hypothetical protein